MQKASAVNTPKKTSTPSTEPALKRRKTDHTTSPDSSGPPTPVTDSRLYADRLELRAATKAQAIAEALAAEKRAQQGFEVVFMSTVSVFHIAPPLIPHCPRFYHISDPSGLSLFNHSRNAQVPLLRSSGSAAGVRDALRFAADIIDNRIIGAKLVSAAVRVRTT